MTTELIEESNKEEIQNSSSLDESGKEEKELDLRGELEKAMKADSSNDEENKEQENKSDSEEDKEKAEEKADDKEKPKTNADPEIELPDSWKARGNKEDWEKVPSSIKKMIADREAEVHKGFTAKDEERNFGKQLKEVIAPYEQMISAEGGNPALAVQSLLNTAYLLRTADPVKKAQLFSQLAQQYEVNLQEVASGIHNIDPIQALNAKIEQMERSSQERQNLAAQQEEAKLQKHIQEFAEKAPHFETLKPMIATFLNGGQANDLQSAYDLAFRAHPETSQEWLNQEISKKAPLQNTNDAKAKVEAAKKAGSSVSGSSGSVNRSEAPAGSLREELERQWNKNTSRI